LAAEFGMSRETFRDVRAAVGADSLDAETDDADGSAKEKGYGVTAAPIFAPPPWSTSRTRSSSTWPSPP
ncbi:hypothetical protein, partial [Promicromonospora kroppenstedtii]